MKIIYVAMGEVDSVEGKEGMKPIAYFFDKQLAEDVSIKEGGCMSTPRRKPAVNEVMVFESAQDRASYTNGGFKRQALAKLTAEEKLVLGLGL
jgi:hypothetical protein